MGDQIPDYIGVWITPWIREWGPRTFWAFLEDDKSQSDPNGITQIKGTIEDFLGEATFEGVVSPQAILFDKKYTSAQNASTARNVVTYLGETGHAVGYLQVQNAYQGDFIMHPNDTHNVLSAGPFLLFPFNEEVHPMPGKGELGFYIKEDMDEILKLTGHAHETGPVSTGLYSVSAILAGASIIDRKRKFNSAMEKRETLIAEFKEKHGFNGEY